MNRVPVIVWNPAYLEELEPVNPATFISGDSQIVIAPASDDGEVVEEIVEEPEVGEMNPVMKDMDDFLGRLAERIQSFKEKLANPDQPSVVPDEVPAAVDGDIAGDIVEGAEEDPKQVLQDAVQSLSRLNDGLGVYCPLAGTPAHPSILMSLTLMYGTQGRLLSRSSSCSPTRPGKG